MSDTATATRGETRELRLAVVLYGGVSLAIYMHGTTKELHRLVKASALAESNVEAEATPSEAFYRELLDELASRDKHGVRTRVVVDVVAGTSAGGINGVYLAKALAHNRSQDALRGLWLTKGDIKKLLRGPSFIPAIVKAPFLLARTVKKSPLRGDAIAQWMYRALDDMDDAGSTPPALDTLMPPRHLLELFVTTTDIQGYGRDLMISDPILIHDRAHRHVFTFRYGDGDDQFAETYNGALAFASRSTMSFPGAFPPLSLSGFETALKEDGVDLSELNRILFRLYELSNTDPRNTYFMDGGVLDNRPFGHAIRAIKRRSAEAEVDRRLLYLEPDPGGTVVRPTAHQPKAAQPSPLATVLAAVSGVPRKEPLLDDILEASRHNERVQRIRDIIELSFGPVGKRVEELVGGDLAKLAESASAADLAQLRTRINEEAQAAAGFAYATYIRSKVSGVVDGYARTICRLSDYPDDCNQAAFVRGVLRSWAKTRLFREEEDGRPAPVDDQVAFLRTFDLGYGARRLRFVIDGLSWWYRDVGKPGFPTREELNEGKRTLYEARDVLLDAMEGRSIGTDLTDEVLACFSQEPIDDWVYKRRQGPEEYAKEHGEALLLLEKAFASALDTALKGFSESLYERVDGIAKGWSVDRRKDLLVRYLGFPFWDILLYPIQSISDAGERDRIDIMRMSPKDVKLLPPLATPKLSGVGIMHFGAFFDRAGRESDYLWGRLDGAERMIGLLLGRDATKQDRVEWCRKAFAAIVAEEEAALPNAKPLLEHARNFGTE